MNKKNKPRPSGDDLVAQLKELLTPMPALPPDAPAAALAAISDWNERWLAIVEQQTPGVQDNNRLEGHYQDDNHHEPHKFAFSRELESFAEQTNYLAGQCEKLGIDSSPLLQFQRDCERTYFGLAPTLPAVPNAVWVMLDRLKLKLQSIHPPSPPKRDGEVPADEAEILVANYLRENRKATIREIATATGISTGRISNDIAAWKAEMARRKASKTPAKGKAPRQLIFDPIGSNDDPSRYADPNDVIWQIIIDKADPQHKAELFAVSPEKKAEIIRFYRENQHELDDHDD